MRRLFVTILIVNMVLAAFAVRTKVHRMSDGSVLHFRRSPCMASRLPTPQYKWDAKRVYRIPVILMSFADRDFAEDHQWAFYHDLFNKAGFNLGHGPGCVADYFRDQSSGLFNVAFDVVGPIKLGSKQKGSQGGPSTGSGTAEGGAADRDNFGERQIREAIRLADDQLDFGDYDLNDDGDADVVVVIYAGYGGNDLGEAADGCIWPNTQTLYLTMDGVRIGAYSASSELWTNDGACGIGTICHELMHVLGLPDLYPTAGDEFSTLDEWALMDGGNYADDGWCPPNLSAQEREYLGWGRPEDLRVTTRIGDMPPYDEGGRAYRIANDAHPDEYYLLENRQWLGWDMMLPGHGLLVTHVDFDLSAWATNSVNANPRHLRMAYFHPDGLDFNYYDVLYGGDAPRDAEGRNLRLAYTAYPYVDGGGDCHDALTDETLPAASLFNKNADGNWLMGKPIKDVREAGRRISFKFYASNADGISSVSQDTRPVAYYDLQGRRMSGPAAGLSVIRYHDGTTKKVIR